LLWAKLTFVEIRRATAISNVRFTVSSILLVETASLRQARRGYQRKDQPFTGRLLPPERQLGQAFVCLQVAKRSLHVQPAGAPIFIAADIQLGTLQPCSHTFALAPRWEIQM
jgi:hypothetical protein